MDCYQADTPQHRRDPLRRPGLPLQAGRPASTSAGRQRYWAAEVGNAAGSRGIASRRRQTDVYEFCEASMAVAGPIPPLQKLSKVRICMVFVASADAKTCCPKKCSICTMQGHSRADRSELTNSLEWGSENRLKTR